MLQQTRIDTVVPYYNRFVKRLPTVYKLACAKIDTVLKLWEGLGYYTRARNLHKAAKVIVKQYEGRFPQDVKMLQKLPGIGQYTAGAIASIAFNIPAPILDGNVVRVLSRLFCIQKDPTKTKTKTQLWQLAEQMVCSKRPGDLNQSMMEFGALVCTPVNPLCDQCPLKRSCLAKKQNLQHDLPVKAASKKLPEYSIAVGVVFKNSKVLIDKRKPEGLLGGLWEFPGGKKLKTETFKQAVTREVREETGIEIEVGRRLMIVRHTYSHFKIKMHVYLCQYQSGTAKPITCTAVKWATPQDLKKYAFPAANQRIIEQLLKGQMFPRGFQ